MNIAWLAAVLAPADVAPHPNFFDKEPSSAASDLALVMQMRWHDYKRRAPAQIPNGQLSHEYALVERVRGVLDASSSSSALRALVEDVQGQTLPFTARTAGALIAATALCELDRHREAISLLEEVSDSFQGRRSPCRDLCHALLTQQIAMRCRELGLVEPDTSLVLSRLDQLRPADFARFDLSRGVRWTSARTTARILEETRTVVREHRASMLDSYADLDRILELVRADAPVSRLKMSRGALGGYVAWIDEEFRATIESREVRIRSGDEVEDRLYEAYLHNEVIGDTGGSKHWRSQVAKLRFLRQGGDLEWRRGDTLRLLRHADDTKTLDLVLRATRADGPLTSLRDDARQIIEQRSAETLRIPELAVLSAAAHLLRERDASRALHSVLGAIEVGVAQTSHREIWALRAERAWRAAASLAPIARGASRVAQGLLNATEAASQDDELLVRGLARAASDLEWDLVNAATRSRWIKALHGRTIAAEVAEAVALGLHVDEVVDTTLNVQVVRALNAAIVDGSPIPEAIAAAGEAAARAEMRSIAAQADRGVFSVGAGPSPADIAAGLIAFAGRATLWRPLVSFLINPRVPSREKTACFDRLARDVGQIPPTVRQRMQSAAEALLRPESVFDVFGMETDAGASALRFLAAHSILGRDRVVTELGRMMAAAKPSVRAAAAETARLLWRRGDHSEWTFAIGYSLSFDSAAVVRAQAGRLLSNAAVVESQFRSLATGRCLELLDEDGLVVPLLVLRGFLDDPAPRLPEQARAAIEAACGEHPARGVRLQAERVLSEVGGTRS